jgi:hypothetical protein
VEFVNARFEDALLPREHFQAVFSASAMHWIDPDFGWRKAADALAPSGTLALIQYFVCDDPRLGRPIRSSILACAVTARRAAFSAS